MDEKEVILIVGLHYLHSLTPRVIHRDLKSMNILIDSAGNAKLTDFGFEIEHHNCFTYHLSRLAKVKVETLTKTSAVGTPQWSSPELLQQVIPLKKYVMKLFIIVYDLFTTKKGWTNIVTFLR